MLTPQLPRTVPWRKLLYIQQPYPDNYTDQSFLSQLKRNSTVSRYSYLQLIRDFSLISFHVTTLTISYIVFFGIYQYNWDATVPASIGTLVSLILYVWYTEFEGLKAERLGGFKSAIFIMVALLTLSPVLKSLSESTSSDSIWSLSVWLSVGNLVFMEYKFDLNVEKEKDTKKVSKKKTSSKKDIKFANPLLPTNILIANIIVLASRLTTTSQVFSFILFSFQLHSLFPIFDLWLRYNFIQLHWILQITVTSITTVIVWSMTGTMVVCLWLFGHFAVACIGPWYFLMLQKYKDELQGPWDTAKPIVD